MSRMMRTVWGHPSSRSVTYPGSVWDILCSIAVERSSKWTIRSQYVERLWRSLSHDWSLKIPKVPCFEVCHTCGHGWSPGRLCDSSACGLPSPEPSSLPTGSSAGGQPSRTLESSATMSVAVTAGDCHDCGANSSPPDNPDVAAGLIAAPAVAAL